MKAFILIFILIMALSGTAYSFEGIAAAWLFNEGSGDNIADSVGNNNGEIEGSLKWVDGKFGKALEFVGAGDSYVTIPHNDIMDSAPYTITAWVKLEPVSWQYIIWKNGVVWPEVHKKRHMDIWVHDADYVVAMWHNEAGVEERIDGTIIVADGTWHHVAKVYDGDTVYLYIDGQVDGEAITSGIAVNGEDPLWIGARPGNVAATGIIDEVGFFTKALSEDDIKEVMSSGLEELSAVDVRNKAFAAWAQIKTR